MELSSLLFYTLASVILVSSILVVTMPNPIFSALFLAITMVTLAFVYMLLQAYFIAGVQLIVYAGAVIVLFVMVLMLFDLKKEVKSYSGGPLGRALKLATAVFILGAIAAAVTNSWRLIPSEAYGELSATEQVLSVKLLATRLFTQYVLAFEVLGVLLLVIAIGVVAVSRARGGTHAR